MIRVPINSDFKCHARPTARLGLAVCGPAPSPLVGEGGARPRSGWEDEGFRRPIRRASLGLMPDRNELRDRARAMRHEQTPAELQLWKLLRGGQLAGLKFRRQVPLGDYIADFACFYPRVIVECDGGQHADNAYDAGRDAWFKAEGFLVLRYWNADVLAHPQEIGETILRAVGRGS